MNDRKEAILDELSDVESLPELTAIMRHWAEEPQHVSWLADLDVLTATQSAMSRLQQSPPVQPEPQGVATVVHSEEPIKRQPVARATRQYKLLSDDVSWSTKPQVLALMAILRAHMEVGETVEESAIVEMMVANEGVLETRQGGKRIWDYYKGNHPEGLIAHGNVERL